MDSDSDGDAPPLAVPLADLQVSAEPPMTALQHEKPHKPVPVTLITGASSLSFSVRLRSTCCRMQLVQRCTRSLCSHWRCVKQHVSGLHSISMKNRFATGFLGAGKSTLVRHILTAQHGRRIAVIVNEFGEELGIERAIVNENDVRKTR